MTVPNTQYIWSDHLAIAGTFIDTGSSGGSLYPSLPAGYSNPDTNKVTFSNGTLNGQLASENGWVPPPTSQGYSQLLRDASVYNPGAGVTAPTNPPASPNLIGEVIYYAGFPSTGIEPGGISGPVITNNNWKGLYLVAYVQLSSNFQSHSSGVNKVVIAKIHGNPCFILSAQSANTWTCRLQNLGVTGGNTGPDGTYNVSNIAGVNAGVTLGRWQRVELQLIANTPGTQNGIIKAWLSNYNTSGQLISGPTLITNVSDVGWANSSQSTVWEGCSWSPIWGGTGGSNVVNQMYEWMDHMSFAGHA